MSCIELNTHTHCEDAHRFDHVELHFHDKHEHNEQRENGIEKIHSNMGLHEMIMGYVVDIVSKR